MHTPKARRRSPRCSQACSSTSPSTPSCASILLTANGAALAPGSLMIALGLASLVFAALMLYRRRDIKRMFAYSSIEHMGIITFAFGMGGPLASFAGLLHMAMHNLTKSAIFFAVGHIAQVKGTQKIAEIRPDRKPSAARLGPRIGGDRDRRHAALRHFHERVPDHHIDVCRQPMLAILLVTGLLIGIGALVLRMQSIAFGEPSESHGAIQASYVPFFIHLTLVLAAGLYLPVALVSWFQTVATLVG